MLSVRNKLYWYYLLLIINCHVFAVLLVTHDLPSSLTAWNQFNHRAKCFSCRSNAKIQLPNSL